MKLIKLSLIQKKVEFELGINSALVNENVYYASNTPTAFIEKVKLQNSNLKVIELIQDCDSRYLGKYLGRSHNILFVSHG